MFGTLIPHVFFCYIVQHWSNLLAETSKTSKKRKHTIDKVYPIAGMHSKLPLWIAITRGHTPKFGLPYLIFQEADCTIPKYDSTLL